MLALAKASLLYAIGCCVPCGIAGWMNERTGNEIKKLPASKRYKPIKKITQQKKAGTYRAPIHSLGNNLAAVWIHHDHRDGRKLVGLGCLDGKRCHHRQSPASISSSFGILPLRLFRRPGGCKMKPVQGTARHTRRSNVLAACCCSVVGFQLQSAPRKKTSFLSRKIIRCH